MPLTLRIESELDERSATAAADRAQRIYTNAAQDMSRSLSEGLTRGAREGGRAVEDMADKARTAYKRVGDATDELRDRERQLKQMREDGARGVEVQAERVRRARRQEKEAIKEAAAAYDEYERAARNAATAGDQAGGSFLSGLRGAVGGAEGAGNDLAEGMVSGFAGAGALARLGAAGGPVGMALAAAAALGVAAGKELADNIEMGLSTLATKDLFQARLGVDDVTMQRLGGAAADAYTNAWGASIEDNMRAAQFAIQGGVIDRDATDADIESAITGLQTLASVMQVDVQEAARSAGQLIRGGFARDSQQAFDILISGSQRGLDIAGDWTDTVSEYTTQWRKLGLDGGDALGLIQQGLEGAARDSDVVADSLKEFSIRAVDGSKSTAEGFEALGFNADEMAKKFAAGGDSARAAFGDVLQAIRETDDPLQQALIWQRLFGTQWEDMGDAINRMDLSTARGEFENLEGATQKASDKLSEHASEWDRLGRNIEAALGKLWEWLAESPVGGFVGSTLPGWLNDMIADPQQEAQAKLDAARREAEAKSHNTFYEDWYPAVTPAPTAPGDRVPIEPDSAGGGGGADKLPKAPVVPFDSTLPPGIPGMQDNAATFGAASSFLDARHTLAEKQARLNQLEDSGVAKADDIQNAKNDVVNAERDLQAAEMRLTEARQNQYEQLTNANEKHIKELGKTTDSLGQLGAKIDEGFGISDGLAGIAENLVTFLANLAFAPAMGALAAVRESFGGSRGGSGLIGGISGMFAPDDGGSVGLPAISRMGPASLSAGLGGPYGLPAGTDIRQGAGGFPPWVYQVANAFGLDASTYSGHQEGRGVNQGIDWWPRGKSDMSGASYTPEELARLDGFSQFLAANGLAEQVIWQNPRTGQQVGYPFGTDYSGDYPDHLGHVHTRFNQDLQLPGAPSGGRGVTGGPGQSWSADWNATAQGESGGNWSINTGNGYYGGLQFAQSSWDTAGGQQYAPRADLASPYQQAMTAERLYAMQGPGAWPNTFVPGSSGPLPPGLPHGSRMGGPGQSFGGGFPASPLLGPTSGTSPGIGSAAGPSQSVMGGRQFGQDLPASSGLGFGGGLIGAAQSSIGQAIQAAATAGAMGANSQAPGSGAAIGAGGAVASAMAQVGIDELNLAAGKIGQYAGAVVGGGLETFSLNDSALADPGRNWFGRLAIAAAGARPAMANTAGMLGGEQNPSMAEGGKPPPPLDPKQAAAMQSAMGKGAEAGKAIRGGDTNITVNNNRATEDGTGRDIQRHLGASVTAKQTTG